MQQKGERWYSPDLGRFVSEDPIQDGANWYAFAGNDPVNHADPSGLSQQGHPLGGGYSGNKTAASAIPNGNLGAGLVTAGSFLYQGARALAPYAKSAVNTALNSVARTVAPSLVTAPPPVRSGVMLPLAPAAEEAVVRQITAGANIKSRPLADLPGIRAAWDAPNQYMIGNHGDQGYNVLGPDGSVRFVTGNDYIPIREQSRRVRIETETAAGRAQFFNAVGEGIAAHPYVETARDGGIYVFGYDLLNPNDRQSQEDMHRAGQTLFIPGLNSKQIKYADDALDALRKAPDVRIQQHHLMTNKNKVSTAAGGPFTPEFEKLAARRGITLKDPSNIVPLTGHRGPHPEYNAEVHKILTDATRGLKGEKFNQAFDQALDHVRTRTLTPGTKLNNLSTGQGGNK